MDQLDYNLKRFADAVYADAENEKKATLEELSAKKSEQFSKIEDQLLRECYQTIQSEISKIKNESQLKLSEETQKARRTLLSRRQEIEDSVFAAAGEKILAYTKTDAYLTYLQHELSAIAPQYQGVACTLVLRQEDMALAEKLCGYFDHCTATAGNITLGGFLLRCPEKNVSVDGTFDTRLENKREEFKQNSGLTID